jgi:hypothetical protein
MDMNTPVKDMKEFGEGVLLYFYMLQYTAIVFCVLSLVPALPSMIFNALGGWYDKADVERTMLGNFGLLSFDGRGSALNLTTAAVALKSRTAAAQQPELLHVLLMQPAAAARARLLAQKPGHRRLACTRLTPGPLCCLPVLQPRPPRAPSARCSPPQSARPPPSWAASASRRC